MDNDNIGVKRNAEEKKIIDEEKNKRQFENIKKNYI
jgi:hypothetical protein